MRRVGPRSWRRFRPAAAKPSFWPPIYSPSMGILALAEQVKRRTKTLAVLVNNAGGSFQARQSTEDQIERTFALNTLAPFSAVAGAAARACRGGGRIVNVATGVPRGTKVQLNQLIDPPEYSGFGLFERQAGADRGDDRAGRTLCRPGHHRRQPAPRHHLGHALRAGHFQAGVGDHGAWWPGCSRMNSSLEQATQRFLQAATGTAQTGTFFDQGKIGTPPQQTQDAAFAVSCGSC